MNFRVSPPQLTIQGQNFGATAPTVVLDGQTLTVQSFSNSQIVAALPARIAAGSYRLAVINTSTNLSAVFTSTIGAVGPQGDGPSLSPLQVATLRWYAANRTAPDIPVGSGPGAVAFDGLNIRVTNLGSDNVTKLRPADGVILGTYPVGANPVGIASDGANIWVANASGNSVTELRVSGGSVMGTFCVGNNPNGVAFDGSNIWVTNIDSSTITELATPTAPL